MFCIKKNYFHKFKDKAPSTLNSSSTFYSPSTLHSSLPCTLYSSPQSTHSDHPFTSTSTHPSTHPPPFTHPPTCTHAPLCTHHPPSTFHSPTTLHSPSQFLRRHDPRATLALLVAKYAPWGIYHSCQTFCKSNSCLRTSISNLAK